MKNLLSAVILFALAWGTCGVYAVPSCCTGKAGGGPRVGAINGNVMKSDGFLYDPRDDTLEYSLSVYGYYGNSWSMDGHSGDPLGTGGKWPLSYTMELYREQNVESSTLLKRDLREQYTDFGYIPLWRMNTLSAFGRYRLSPELTSAVQMVYGGDPGKPGVNSNGSVGVGEVSLQWTPLLLRNFWLRAGNILDAGTYSSLFDQNPMENFLYTGAMASWAADFGDDLRTVTTLAGGATFFNSTYLRDPLFSYSVNQGYIRAGRQRTYAYAKTSALIRNRIGVKALAGVQYVPADSSLSPVDRMYHYAAAAGAVAGLEATWFGAGISHTAMATFAFGDATLGWGAPDYVIKPVSNNQLHPDRMASVEDYSFTRQGSGAFNFLYWAAFEHGPFHLSAGMWYNARLPAKNAVIMENPTSDSVRALLPAGELRDSIVTMKAEDFHAVRFSLFPSVRIGISPLFIGVRFDNITFLTPQAHTNFIEFERDQTLRPATFPGIESQAAAYVYGPARWDREAVNATVVAPTLRLDFGDLGGITAAWAMGFYDKPVDRQGRISNFHGNFTLGADMLIAIKKTKMIKP